MIFNYYCIKYINFYHKETQYSLINSITLTIGGFSGNLLAGYIADKYDRVNLRAKSYVASIECMIGVPICLMLFLTQFSFSLSCFLLFLKYLLSDGWLAPCLAMIQSIVEVKFKSIAIGGLYLCFSYTTAISSMLTGYLITKLEIGNDF